MGKGLEETSLKRRYTDGQQVRHKMLNVIGLQGNSNQNDSAIPLQTHQDGHDKQNAK